MRILIIGVNGFIGSNLSQRILETTDWDVFGTDINIHYIKDLIDHERFHFAEGDLCINNEWIEYHVKKCDIVLPLVAIAQPKVYVTDPLKVFELDFEENLKVVRWVHKYKKRLIFPSTSEVYGMCTEDAFSEETSNLIYGPINKTRWIYACSKQLLDRVIYAYGRDYGLRYTCFRPFNWIGPRLDTMESARYGNSRVLTQFITNLCDNKPIQLVQGGQQERCFTDINDGLDALMAILTNEDATNARIFNIGNPDDVCSIARLAELTLNAFCEVTGKSPSDLPGIEVTSAEDYYGKDKGYQDVVHRVPDISLAKKLLDWQPSIPLESSVRSGVEYFVKHYPFRKKPQSFSHRPIIPYKITKKTQYLQIDHKNNVNS